MWETERQRRCKVEKCHLKNAATPAICDLQADIQARKCTQTLAARWKEQRDTERWASNCLTFLLAGGAETVGKDKLTLTEKKLNLTLQAAAASSPLSVFGIFQMLGCIKVLAEA